MIEPLIVRYAIWNAVTARIHGGDRRPAGHLNKFQRSRAKRRSSTEYGWRLVCTRPDDSPRKQMHNHWGVRVATADEVDRAYDYLVAHKAEYNWAP